MPLRMGNSRTVRNERIPKVTEENRVPKRENQKGFIDKYIFMYKEFVLVFGARDIYKQ